MSTKLYASITNTDRIESINVNSSHGSAVTLATVIAETTTLNIGDSISIDLGYNTNHSTVFTGYVKQIDYNSPNNLYTISAHDAMVKAVDYFVVSTDPNAPFERSNIAAEILVKQVLALAGLTNYGYDATLFTLAIGTPAQVSLVSSYDYCKSIADLLTWHLYADVNGKVWFVNRKPFVMLGDLSQPGDKTDTSLKTITDSSIINGTLGKNETDLRNRVVVWGDNGIYSEAKSTTSYDPILDSNISVLPTGFYKTTAFQSYALATQGLADKAATYNLQLFNRLKYTSGLSILGDPDINARVVITLNSTQLNINHDFYVYTAEHAWSKSGYTTNLELTT